jgi:predicted nicotinamide N-methyase
MRVIEAVVSLGERQIVLLRPEDSEALLDEEAFAREEFLPYWAELWPSAVALAGIVSARALRGRRVVELGCGLALPSIAAALAGADVLATDWSADAVALAARNARRNAVRLNTAICDWTAPERLLDEAPWELVLASDVLYERRNVDPLLALLPRLVAAEGEVLIADPGRPAWAGFLERAAAAWRVAELESGVYVFRPAATA